MGQKNVFDVGDSDVFIFKGRQQQGHAVIDAGIHECGPPLFDDQVTRVLLRTRVLGIDSDYTVSRSHRPGAQLVFRRCFKAFQTRVVTSQHLDVGIAQHAADGHHDPVLALAVAVLLERINQVILMLSGQCRPGRGQADAVLAMTGGAGAELSEPPAETATEPRPAR